MTRVWFTMRAINRLRHSRSFLFHAESNAVLRPLYMTQSPYSTTPTRYPLLNSQSKPTTNISQYKREFDTLLAQGERWVDYKDALVLCGRVVSRPRKSGKKLYFYHIQQEGESVQVLADSSLYSSSFHEVHQSLRYGDIVSVSGFPAKSRKGELSIVPREVTVLAPCTQDIPIGRGDGKHALADKATRYKQRHLDLLSGGPEATKPFLVRARAISFLRKFLDDRGFLEVETPVLSRKAGGALAKPFVTHSSSRHEDLSLRIAPELFLKRLVVSGFDKVYEIGRVFRNEDTSLTHNPEFTTCEFYQAYADHTDLLEMTELLISSLALDVLGTTKISDEIDLKAPFQRVDIVPALQAALNLREFPDISDATKVQEVGEELEHLATQSGIIVESTSKHSLARNCKLVDGLIGKHLEPKCVSPTFLCNHPLVMSPLAKAHAGDQAHLAQRFELFINRMEIANAYTELNDPNEQRSRLIQQKRVNDQIVGSLASEKEEEEMPVDEDYCRVLEYGLPPTAGWGMGIDRLVMLLSNRKSIKDVILFPFV